MKLFPKALILAIPCLLLLSMLLGSCKNKGCTDKNALNYSSAAGEDDGTCVYCQTTATIQGSHADTLYDWNASSQFCNLAVIKATFSSCHFAYTATKCGTDSCQIILTFQNLVNKTIVFSCFYNLITPSYYNWIFNITIPPNGILNIGSIYSIASTSSCSTPIASIDFNGNPSYH